MNNQICSEYIRHFLSVVNKNANLRRNYHVSSHLSSTTLQKQQQYNSSIHNENWKVTKRSFVSSSSVSNLNSKNNNEQISLIPELKSMKWEELSEDQKVKFTTFSRRLGIEFENNKLRLVEALSHRSFAPEVKGIHSSERLQNVGEKVLALYVTEYVFAKYPKLPGDALESVVEAYCGLRTLSDVADLFGVANVMRWKPIVDAQGKTGSKAIAARILQSIIGAIYVEKGGLAVRKFIQNHFLSRKVDITAHLNLSNPKYALLEITQALGRKRPVARLLKETGAHSRNPVYLVGMYSGVDKIGEGYGDSTTMAEERAAKDALKNYFMTELAEIKLPSDRDDTSITFFEIESEEGQVEVEEARS